MINNLVSYFKPDGTPTDEGLKFFRQLDDQISGITGLVTPDQFGAVGDGATDDLDAFDAMFASLGSRGGRVFIPPKSYYLDGNLDIFNTTVSVTGVPSSVTSLGSRLLFSANRGLRLANNDGSAFRDLRIDGPTSGASSGALIIVGKLGEASGSTYCVFDHVQTNGGYRSLWLQKSLETRFSKCRFNNATGPDAVLLSGGVDATEFTVDAAEFVQCAFSGSSTTDCIHLNGAANSVKMTQCVVLFGETGLKFTDDTSSGDFPKFFYFSDGGFENCENYAVFVDEGDDIKFSNAYFSNDSAALDVIHLSANVDGRVKVIGSTIRGGGRDGVRALGGRVTVALCDVINNARAVTGDGIRIGSGIGKYTLTDNYIGDGPDGTNNQRYGIFNDGAAGVGVISGNSFDGNATGDYGGSTGSAVTGESP